MTKTCIVILLIVAALAAWQDWPIVTIGLVVLAVIIWESKND